MMKQTPFNEIWRRYNQIPGDDPGGAGTAPGQNFDVAGLRAQPGDGDGLPGRIFFPEVGNVLNETFVDPLMGIPVPKDLNGDNDATDTNVTNYLILPVRVVVDWRGAGGNTHLEITTFLFP
jgi:hypothetical protein